MLAMLPIFAKRHCQFRQTNSDGNKVSRVYDLGCSLGAVSFALAGEFAPQDLQIKAIDISEPMIAKAQSVLMQHYPEHD
ncbi:class I SAM-dependent methyltransferase, partial [Mycobacterium tuberculosis]|nr:class I SAM-dependent methyltransferase [Mycobacterium tuberculosis]